MASTAKLAPRPVVTWDKAQRIWRNWEIFKDNGSIVHKLPDHYKRRYWANILADRTPVHYTPPQDRYEWNAKKNIRVEKEHFPIHVIYPPEFDRLLCGGEGIVKCYIESKPHKRIRGKPTRWYGKYFWPALGQTLFYSEILDRFMLIWSTRLADYKVDMCQGFDNYILKTPEIDLVSKLGLSLKREMLLALARKDYYPNDDAKRKEIEEKYKEFVIPEEEAEWVGLDLNEACRKLQDRLELEEKTPLKFKYERQMVEKLKLGIGLSEILGTEADEKAGSIMSKIRNLKLRRDNPTDEKR